MLGCPCGEIDVCFSTGKSWRSAALFKTCPAQLLLRLSLPQAPISPHLLVSPHSYINPVQDPTCSFKIALSHYPWESPLDKAEQAEGISRGQTVRHLRTTPAVWHSASMCFGFSKCLQPTVHTQGSAVALTWSELTVIGSFNSSHTMHSSQGGVVKEPW